LISATVLIQGNKTQRGCAVWRQIRRFCSLARNSLKIGKVRPMFLGCDMRRRVMVVKKLRGLLKRKPERFPDLRRRQFPLGVSLQYKGFQKLA
jgi:hypothetical protein